jgi:predicted aspartyl protease
MITGYVDDYGRPLVRVTVHHPTSGQSLEVETWIDTGSTGAFLLTPSQQQALNLTLIQTVPMIVASGTQAFVDNARCEVDWFGKRHPTKPLVCPGKLASLGLYFLQDCERKINYPARTVTITPVEEPVTAGQAT